METKSYCAACGHWGRHAVTFHVYNLHAGGVKLDLEHLSGQRCGACKRTFVTREALKATLQQVVERVMDHDPNLPKPRVRGIVAKVAKAFMVG